MLLPAVCVVVCRAHHRCHSGVRFSLTLIRSPPSLLPAKLTHSLSTTHPLNPHQSPPDPLTPPTTHPSPPSHPPRSSPAAF